MEELKEAFKLFDKDANGEALTESAPDGVGSPRV